MYDVLSSCAYIHYAPLTSCSVRPRIHTFLPSLSLAHTHLLCSLLPFPPHSSQPTTFFPNHPSRHRSRVLKPFPPNRLGDQGKRLGNQGKHHDCFLKVTRYANRTEAIDSSQQPRHETTTTTRRFLQGPQDAGILELGLLVVSLPPLFPASSVRPAASNLALARLVDHASLE